MKIQKLYSLVRQAIDKYSMIEKNDRIAIGVSGGKDSLALLYALAGLRQFYPIKFDIIAVTVDLGYGNFELNTIEHLCNTLNVELHVIKTQIKDILSEHNKNKSYCSLCSKLRKGALNHYITPLGCNKVAYAHNMDDVIETMFMSLIYEGRFYSFPPVTFMEDINISVIRPLIYVSESEIIGFKNKYSIEVAKNPCPFDGHTKRQYIKNLINNINKENPNVKKKLFHAIENGNIDDWQQLIINQKE